MFWVEKKKVSPEVVAVAIEEMRLSIDNPHIGYLEGILRNWTLRACILIAAVGETIFG